jgi:hypothetical protein
MSRAEYLYTLDDGSVLTMKELMKVTGISRKTLWVRLQTINNIEELSQPTPNMIKNRGHKNYYEDTYSDLSPELIKLLFGKWET